MYITSKTTSMGQERSLPYVAALQREPSYRAVHRRLPRQTPKRGLQPLRRAAMQRTRRSSRCERCGCARPAIRLPPQLQHGRGARDEGPGAKLPHGLRAEQGRMHCAAAAERPAQRERGMAEQFKITGTSSCGNLGTGDYICGSSGHSGGRANWKSCTAPAPAKVWQTRGTSNPITQQVPVCFNRNAKAITSPSSPSNPTCTRPRGVADGDGPMPLRMPAAPLPSIPRPRCCSCCNCGGARPDSVPPWPLPSALAGCWGDPVPPGSVRVEEAEEETASEGTGAAARLTDTGLYNGARGERKVLREQVYRQLAEGATGC